MEQPRPDRDVPVFDGKNFVYPELRDLSEEDEPAE